MKCPACGTESNGRFCPSCGASLDPKACAKCHAALVPGARFCTQCGTPAGAGPAPLPSTAGSGNLPWYLGGAVLLIVAIILALPLLRTEPVEQAGPPINAPFAGPGSTGTPPPLSDNPRENADRLFNRIMSARENGAAAEVQQFAPMAIQAYAMAEPLDNDGLYHLATIQTAAGMYDDALRTAERILSTSPTHLLGLGAAGEAAAGKGDSAAAKSYFDRFEAAFTNEAARQLPEYLDHNRIFPQYQAAARR